MVSITEVIYTRVQDTSKYICIYVMCYALCRYGFDFYECVCVCVFSEFLC